MAAIKTRTDGWYPGAALQGAVTLGTVPILLPLLVEDAAGASEAGLVMATLYLGTMSAPIWGSLADRTGQHALLFLASFPIIAGALAVLAITRGLGLWLPLVLLLGAGVAAGNTLAGILIVGHRPKAEWGARIGWLQTFYGGGWMVGLGFAAWLHTDPEAGLLISAALLLPAMAVGWVGLPGSKAGGARPTALLSHGGHWHAPQAGEVLGHFQRISLDAIHHVRRNMHGDFGLLLTGWFLESFGAASVFGLYPLLMDRAYDIDPGLSSAYLTAAVGVSVLLYAPSGALSERLGDFRVVTIARSMVLVATGGLALLAFVEMPAASWLAPAPIFLLSAAWPLRIVAGTSLAVHLAPLPKGQALGLFNAVSASASVLGALAAGGFADTLGYGSIPVLAAAAALIGTLYLVPLASKLAARRR